MQIKITMAYTSYHLEQLLFKELIMSVGKNLWRNWHPCTLLVKIHNDTAAMEKSIKGPQKN